MLREATDKGSVDFARYYYHERVCVDGHDYDIRKIVRRSLEMTKVADYKVETLMPPSSTTARRISRKGRSSAAPVLHLHWRTVAASQANLFQLCDNEQKDRVIV